MSDIIDKHKGSVAVVDLFGPSGKIHRDTIDLLAKEKQIIRLSCNNWWEHLPSSPPPDYWVLASNVDTVSRYLSEINKHKETTTLCYASSVDRTTLGGSVLKMLEADYLPYDQKHHDGLPLPEWCCGPKGCEAVIVSGRLTIQQELEKLSGYSPRYGSGDTVAVHMIAFAILMGCKTIYLNGLDLDYGKGYANGSQAPRDTIWKECADRQTSTFDSLNESAKLRGSKIINLCTDAWYGVFKSGQI